MNRSIIILPAFLFVALLLTVVYALLGLRGPEAVLREARRALDEAQYKKSIQLLNDAENALDDNRSGLLEQTLRMRVAAYEQLHLRVKVLEDIKTLFERLGVRDRDLMSTRIRMHNELAAELEDSAARKRALELAIHWLEDHRSDAYVLAQAGFSVDLDAKWQFEKWLGGMRSQTPPSEHERLERLMATAVYSTAGQQIHENQMRILTSAMERLVPGSMDETIAMVDQIRAVALAARGHFLESLSNGTEPTAYRGMARQLRRAHDDDTLLMIAHSYLRRAHPRRGLTAAVDIADVHLRHQRLQAAIKIAQRTLPLGSSRQRYLDGQLDHAALRLILCRALAVTTLGDKNQARDLLADFRALLNDQDQGVIDALEAFPIQHLIFGLLLDDAGMRRAHLINYTNADQSRTTTWNRKMLTDTAYRHLVMVCTPGERGQVISNWMRSAPDEAAPVHAFAKYQAGRGAADESVPPLENALKNLPDKDATLELLISAQITMFPGDIDKAINRASALAIVVPDEIGTNAALTIAVARRAMEMQSFGVAMGCCDHARKLFPGTRVPAYLKAKILLAMAAAADDGRKDIDRALVIRQAEEVVKLLLEEDPADRKALGLLMRARAAGGKTSDALRFESLLRGMPDLDSTRFLARHWLARDAYDRVLRLSERATEQFGPDLEMQVLATKALMADPDTDPQRVRVMLNAVYGLTSGTADPTPRERELMLWSLSKYVLLNPEKLTPKLLAGLLDKFLLDNKSTKDLEDLAKGLAKKGELDLAIRAYSDLTSNDRYKEGRRGEQFVAAGRVALRMGNKLKAVEWFQAAAAFEGGGAAAMELALLKRLAGEKHDFKPKKVDTIRAACLTPDREAAVAYLQTQLKANPQSMSAQCVLAVMQPNDNLSPRIRSIATLLADDLIVLIALLQDNAYAVTALEHVKELRKNYKDNEVLFVLQARAHAQSRAFAEVGEDLSAAGKSLVEDKTLMAEALEILASCDSPLVRNSKVMEHLLSIVMRLNKATPPSLMATLLRYNKHLLEIPGMRHAILPRVSQFWMEHPKIANVGLPEVQMLVTAGNYATALILMKRIEFNLDPKERGAFLELYFSTMDKIAPVAEPLVVAQMAKQAVKVLETECVHGAPLHFLMRVLDKEIQGLEGTEEGSVALQRMLEMERLYLPKHVDYFLTGADKNVYNLAATLRRLGRREGFKRGLALIDKVLRRDPSLLPVWLLRAEWLVQLNRVDDAVVSLVWLPRYLKDPAIVDTLVQLMGRSGILVSRGKDLTMPELLEKGSKLTLGMVLLRFGSYVKAANAFGLAEPRDDGTHLYYRAMALLGVQTKATEQEARRLLVQVFEDFEDSSFAESARTVVKVFQER
jgi:tetratricopeptide (TPR) repeat protein